MKIGSFELKDMEVCIEIIHAAIARNYPEMKKADVEELIDMRNMVPVVQAVMNISGFEAAKPGE
jgi:hypothetical protein